MPKNCAKFALNAYPTCMAMHTGYVEWYPKDVHEFCEDALESLQDMYKD